MEKLFDIIHEDADLLVVHKPAGLVCHPTKGDEYSSLISRARLHLKSGQAHLVHRLDRETSGVVLFAKNAGAARELGKIWETRGVEKEYLAIVHGHVMAEEGMIDAPLGKDEASRVAIKDCVRADGAPAQTQFYVEKRFSRALSEGPDDDKGENQPQPFSLLRVSPRTGRKHQIRIHLAHIGHAIIGDKLYGGDEDLYLSLVENRLTESQQSRLILKSHALHAASLKFHWRNEDHHFQAQPGDILTGFMDET